MPCLRRPLCAPVDQLFDLLCETIMFGVHDSPSSAPDMQALYDSLSSRTTASRTGNLDAGYAGVLKMMWRGQASIAASAGWHVSSLKQGRCFASFQITSSFGDTLTHILQWMHPSGQPFLPSMGFGAE